MRQKTTTIILLLTTGCAVALSHVRAYAIDPVKAQWSGWTRTVEPYDRISQTITCNFDSLKYVELFAGWPGDIGNDYRLGVIEDGVEVMWSSGTQDRDHSWVRFENWNDSIAFTKGRQYEFKFTRAGSDSINYYYRWDSSYPYGGLKVGGSSGCGETYPVEMDLAMRVYGAMDARTFWSVTDTSSLIPA